MAETNMKTTSIEVKAELRELRCEYTRVMVDDLSSYQGMRYDSDTKPIDRKNSINKIFKLQHDS